MKKIAIGVAAVGLAVLSGCSSSSTESVESTSTPAPTLSGAASGAPSAAASTAPALIPLTEDSLFDALPSLEDASKWGLKDMEDIMSNGNNLNQIAPFDDMSPELSYAITDGDWSRVKPAKCAPIQALASPQSDSDAELAGFAGYTDSNVLGIGYTKNQAAVSVVSWPSADVAQARFDEAAAAVDGCGTYTVKQPANSYSATRWSGSPKVTDTAILAMNSQGLGTVMGVQGNATYSIVIIAKSPEKIIDKAQAWVAAALEAAQTTQ